LGKSRCAGNAWSRAVKHCGDHPIWFIMAVFNSGRPVLAAKPEEVAISIAWVVFRVVGVLSCSPIGGVDLPELDREGVHAKLTQSASQYLGQPHCMPSSAV
jgi:hypothetical protein